MLLVAGPSFQLPHGHYLFHQYVPLSWPPIHHGGKGDLELLILFNLPHNCWDDAHAWTCLARFYFHVCGDGDLTQGLEHFKHLTFKLDSAMPPVMLILG